MMSHVIDWGRPYGRVSPPISGACLEQFGRYFDSNGQEVHIPGMTNPQPVPQASPPAGPPVPETQQPQATAIIPHAQVGYSEADLILMADDAAVTFQFLRRHARDLLDDCPAKKEDIVAALKDRIVARALATATYQPIEPQTLDPTMQSWAGMNGGSQQPTAPPAPPETAVPPEPAAQESGGDDEGSVDLKAWAEGRKDYLWGDVQKAIRDQHKRMVTEKHDAIEFLIGEGIVSAAAARTFEPESPAAA